jgi:putative transcriptional regulator
VFKPENIENDFFIRIGFDFDPEQLGRGKVLISEPFMSDPNFNRSVVLLTEYTKEEGAFGFILNKPTDLLMSDIMKEFPDVEFPFHYGGPVDPENLFFIHTVSDLVEDSRPILDDLHWSGDFDTLKSLISMGKVDPSDLKFFGGYSGWGEGQLEEELSEHSWIIADVNVEQIMNNDHEELWKNSLKKMGSKFSIMANFPENPGLN